MKEGGDIAVNVCVWGEIDVSPLGGIDRVVNGKAEFEVVKEKVVWVAQREGMA